MTAPVPSYGEPSYSSGSGGASIPVPSGVTTGTLVVLAVLALRWDGTTIAPSDITVPTGFALGAASPAFDIGVSSQILWFYKYATGADSGTYAIGAFGGIGGRGSVGGVALTISGGTVTGNPFVDDERHVSSNTAATDLTIGNSTPGGDDSLFLAFSSLGGGPHVTRALPTDWANVASLTPDADGDYDYLDSATQGAAAATGELSWTGGADNGVLSVVTIRPGETVEHPYLTGVSGRHFVDQNGDPWLMKGQSGVYLLQNTDLANAEDALAVIAASGANMVWVNLIQDSGTYAGKPTYAYGASDGVYAFTDGAATDFTSPNETYWARVDAFITQAANLGITVGCVPNYTYAAVDLYAAGSASWEAYAEFLANRYGDRPNVFWILGQDWDPSHWSDYGTMWQAFYDAFRAISTAQLWTVDGYGQSPTDADLSTGITALTGVADFEWGYSYQAAYRIVGNSRGISATIPVVMGDGYSEDFPTNSPSAWSARGMRRQAGWSYASGAAGETYVWAKMWFADQDYSALSASPTMGQIKHIRDAVESIDWWTLEPSSTFITSGRGTDPTSGTNGDGGVGPLETDYATASVSADGKVALLYLPTSRAFGIDTSQLAAGATCQRIDPTNGASTTVAVTSSMPAPGNNAAGDSDWLYAFTATGDTAMRWGDSTPAAFRWGDAAVDALYLGDTKVFG